MGSRKPCIPAPSRSNVESMDGVDVPRLLSLAFFYHSVLRLSFSFAIQMAFHDGACCCCGGKSAIQMSGCFLARFVSVREGALPT